MEKEFESISMAANSVFSKKDFYFLKNNKNLVTLNVNNCHVKDLFNLLDLEISNCNELSSLSINGTLGFLDTVFPQKWALLTKLGYINFANCGFNQASVTSLVISLDSLSKIGLGSAISTTKTFVINGQNAKPLLTEEFNAAKASLIANGWTITHG